MKKHISDLFNIYLFKNMYRVVVEPARGTARGSHRDRYDDRYGRRGRYDR